ncbi:TatD DNase [Conglomerata obtusa]
MIFDISFNATYDMYNGIYNKKQKHDPDLDIVLQRSYDNGVIPFIVGTNYGSSLKSIEIAKTYNTYCYVGIHPNDASNFIHEINKVIELIQLYDNIYCTNLLSSCSDYTSNKPKQIRFLNKEILNPIIAVGECGLDYYRQHSSMQDQKYIFKKLLDLNKKHYFIHSRNSHRDLMEILCDYNIEAVIHSFDGTIEEANEIIKKGYYIGINGHSIKENCDMLNQIDINKILLETDAPYCNIGKSYDGYKYIKSHLQESKKDNQDLIFKGRNEPCKIIQVVEALSEIYNIEYKNLEKILYKNALEFFDLIHED